LDDTLPHQIAALRERIAQVPTAYEHESYGKGTLPPWVQAPSGCIQDQIADFLNVLLDSLEIPQPATKADRPVYEDVLDRRTFNAVLALTGILGFGPDELPESTNYLREVTEDFPVDGYQHA
jgi:hypothetical protein